jgi:PKD repeat protein
VTVNPIPATPTITPGGPTTFCAGGSVVLTSSSATGNVWSPGGATTQSITANASGTYTVHVTTAGCSSANSAPITVTLTPAPTPNFAFSTAGLTATFLNTSQNNPTSYVWDFGDLNTSTSTNPTHTYSAPGTYNVCLTAINTCGSNQTCQNVTVCLVPNAAFSFSASNLQVAFTDGSTNVPVAWHWDFGDGNTSTAQNPTHNYAAVGTYNVCLISQNSCGADTSCTSITVVCPAPNAAFTALPLGFSVSFTVQSSSGGSAIYAWDFGDGNTSTQFNPTHTYAAGGIYNVCLTVTSDCGTDNFCLSVTVACPAPAVDFFWAQNGLVMTFTDLTANTPISWEWDFGDGGTSTLQNPAHTYAALGTYNVCLTVTNDCDTSTSCKAVDVLVGVRDPQAWSELTLYPNPAQDLVTLHGLADKGGLLNTTLFDVFGRKLIATESQVGRDFSQDLSLEGLSAGVYFVEVSKGGQSKVFRLVVE